MATARSTAKDVLRRAEAGEPGAAEVLVDALIYAGEPAAAESLVFALQGRAYSDLGADSRDYPYGFKRGAPLPLHLAVMNRVWALDLARRSLFPIRRPPCMPNRHDVRRLFLARHGVSVEADPTVARMERDLWRRLTFACRTGDTTSALRFAVDVLRGDGVRWSTIMTRRGPREIEVGSVDTRDATDLSLHFDTEAARFRVTSFYDLIELYERRHGSPDDIGGWP